MLTFVLQNYFPVRMKSIFRTIAALFTVLVAVSCNIDFIYVQLPNTSWTIEQGEQKAFVHFGTNERVSILQRSNANGAVQLINGTFDADGHSVNVLSDEGATNKLVRTFTHLKNSSNKNFSRFSPQDYSSLENTIWATVRKDVFRLFFLAPGGEMTQLSFKNVIHEEGVPYGWEKQKGSYSVNGSHVTLGQESGILFPEVMLVDDTWFMHFPVNGDEGTSALTGSIWTYRSSGYPGVIIFDTNSSFTRVLMASRTLFQVTQGSYTFSGNTVTMTLDGKTESCEMSGNSFTLMEKTYDKYE